MHIDRLKSYVKAFNETRGEKVEAVIRERVNEQGTIKYLVKWKGFTASHNSWLTGEELKGVPDVMRRYKEEKEHKKGKKRGGIKEQKKQEKRGRKSKRHNGKKTAKKV